MMGTFVSVRRLLTAGVSSAATFQRTRLRMTMDADPNEQLDECEPALFFLLVIIIPRGQGHPQGSDESVPGCREGDRTAINVKR
jgi:hypothetical protein